MKKIDKNTFITLLTNEKGTAFIGRFKVKNIYDVITTIEKTPELPKHKRFFDNAVGGIRDSITGGFINTERISGAVTYYIYKNIAIQAFEDLGEMLCYQV